MPKSATRRNRGSGIIEGVVGMMLIIGGTVAAIVLLMNSAAATYHKEKIGFVANQAALYATTLTDNSTRQAQVTDLATKLLASMGIDAGVTTVTITDTTLGSQPAVSVTVTSAVPTMFASNFSALVPQTIQMSDTAVAPKPFWFWGYAVGTLPTGQSLTFPLINATGALPNDGLPAYSLSALGLIKIR